MTRSFSTSVIVVVFLCTVTRTVFGQAPDSSSKRLPVAEDVASIEGLIGAVYDVISGPASEERDWERFRSLFAPVARLTPIRADTSSGKAHLVVMTPDEFIDRVGPVFRQPGGFFENEIGRTTEVYGKMAHAFSAYESLREDATEPFSRGINSFQLFNDGERWFITSILWEQERPDNVIPDTYLFE